MPRGPSNPISTHETLNINVVGNVLILLPNNMFLSLNDYIFISIFYNIYIYIYVFFANTIYIYIYNWIWTCPTYAHSSSFSAPAEIMMVVMIVDGGPIYNYNFPIPKSNYEYLYYHYQKAITNIGTKIITFTCFFTTDMFINANLTIFSGFFSPIRLRIFSQGQKRCSCYRRKNWICSFLTKIYQNIPNKSKYPLVFSPRICL